MLQYAMFSVHKFLFCIVFQVLCLRKYIPVTNWREWKQTFDRYMQNTQVSFVLQIFIWK